jgi:D-alanyl-D-alanine carboxypeptidase
MKLLINKKDYLYFVMVAFVFISTTALSLNKSLQDRVKSLPSQVFLSGNFPENPVLKSELSTHLENQIYPTLSAQGAIAVDLNSGVSLYEKNPDATLLPASTTKIITALVALDTYSLDQVLTVPKGVKVDGQKMGLYVGEQMKVENLLYGLLVYSANDAAMTLAINFPGGYDSFIAAMNNKAADLSMTNSRFENPVGLDGTNQRTTVKDLLRASEVAMKNPQFAKFVGTKSVTLTDASGYKKYNLKNLNILLDDVPGVLGVKTGWTENARENLVTYIDRDGKKIIVVILGSQDRFGETKELIDWVFASYEWQKVNVPMPVADNK